MRGGIHPSRRMRFRRLAARMCPHSHARPMRLKTHAALELAALRECCLQRCSKARARQEVQVFAPVAAAALVSGAALHGAEQLKALPELALAAASIDRMRFCPSSPESHCLWQKARLAQPAAA